MRALRDFNTPRIPHHDTPIFLRIINDLFISFVVTSRITAPEPELSLRVTRCTEVAVFDFEVGSSPLLYQMEA
ncbi:hypothetical protein L915_12268 [Phytophthora nicotianae]|uniref:Uncharacterized protein n=1 Tax=Phytophthora nicotianae TaxID=4792 RepID=W2GJ59_PHYNI|nr:hypothetical protein L915_12268 [Phytophthora nicotianae]